MTRDEYRAKCAKHIARVLSGNVSEEQWNANPEEYWQLSDGLEILDSLNGVARVCPIEATEEMILAGRSQKEKHGGLLGSMDLIWRAMSIVGDLTNQKEDIK